MNIKIARKLYRAGLTVSEIAEVLKISTNAVANMLQHEIYDAVECNGGIPLDSVRETIERERGENSHIVVSRENEDGNTNPSGKDDDTVQRRSHGLQPDFESVHQGIGGTLAESTNVDDPDAGLSALSDTNLDRLGLFALADAVRGLANAIRSATNTTVIPKGDDR